MFVVPVWKPRHPPPGFLFWRAASRRQHAVEPAQGIVVHIAVMTAGQRDVECDDTHGVWAKSYLKPVRRSQAHRCRGRFDSGDSRTAVGITNKAVSVIAKGESVRLAGGLGGDVNCSCSRRWPCTH